MQWSMAGVVAWAVLHAGAGPPEVPPSSAPKAAVPESKPLVDLKPLADWPRMRQVDFGCMLARAGAEIDPKWACGSSAPLEGDPCKDIANYYAGPEFPPSLLTKLPLATSAVALSWEHGQLQEVTLHLAPGVDAVTARAALAPADLPVHIQSVDVQECGRDHLCASLTGFDHIGAGEVDCKD